MKIKTETIELKSVDFGDACKTEALYLLQLQRDQLISRVDRMIRAITSKDLCGND